jgi:hypothetical protein
LPQPNPSAGLGILRVPLQMLVCIKMMEYQSLILETWAPYTSSTFFSTSSNSKSTRNLLPATLTVSLFFSDAAASIAVY